MSELEQAARALVALWDEPMDDDYYSERHECMLDMMSACKRMGWASELASAIARLADELES